MFVNALKMQIYDMLRKKITIITFFVLMGFVLANFFSNMQMNIEMHYTSQMYDPIKLLTLSEWSNIGYFLFQYFPILVVIPTACSYLRDKNTRIKVYIEARCGKKYYWMSKAMAVFVTTFLLFTIPFLTELIFSGVCFDLNSHGDISNFQYIYTIENDNQYVLYQLYINNKVLYAVVMICFFGIVSGILALFNFAITLLPVFTFKVLTFFPIYVLIYIISFVGGFLKLKYDYNYMFVLKMFNSGERNMYAYSIFFILLIAGSVGLIFMKMKKDDII